ncbi:MAG: hypothetical protein ACKOCT_12235 [Alphaproteobacteria bacterium]
MPPDTANSWRAPGATIARAGSIFGAEVVIEIAADTTFPFASVHTTLPWSGVAVCVAVKVNFPPETGIVLGETVPPLAEQEYGAVPPVTAKTWLPPDGTVAEAGWRTGDSAEIYTVTVATCPVASRQRMVASKSVDEGFAVKVKVPPLS